MNNVFIILCMIFCHVIADYNLQGWLASAKQKSYWEKNAPDEMYKHDYICALVMHSFSWTFMIMLPLMYAVGFKVNSFLLFLFISNVLMHAITDNFKANTKVINLWQDQSIHMYQIVITAALVLLQGEKL